MFVFCDVIFQMSDRSSPTLGGMYNNSREQQEHNQRLAMMGHVLNEKKLVSKHTLTPRMLTVV